MTKTRVGRRVTDGMDLRKTAKLRKKPKTSTAVVSKSKRRNHLRQWVF